jgi:hypothetical protein
MTAVLSLHRLNNNNGCLLAGRRQSEGKHFSAYDTLRPVPHPMYLHMQRNAADQQAMGTRHFARRAELLDTYHVASYSVELAWLSAYSYYRFRFWLRRAVPRTRGCAAVACCRAEPTRQAGRDASTPQARSLGRWETPAVTPRTTACAPHAGAEQCSSRQGRRHIYTPSSYSESGGWKANIRVTHCHTTPPRPSTRPGHAIHEVRSNQAHLYSFDRTVHCKTGAFMQSTAV